MGLSLNWRWPGAWRGNGARNEVGRLNADGSKFLAAKGDVANSLVKNEADSWAQGVAGSGVATCPGAEDSTSDSNCSSWPMKLKLGDTSARRCLMRSKASSSCSRWVLMM